MIPRSDTSDLMFRRGIKKKTAPIHTWRLHVNDMRLEGQITDDIEAVKQMVYKCINTEKGQYIIYPTFGLQKKDLFFRPKVWAYTKLKYRIKEALTLDDRVEDVDDFVFHRRESVRNDLVMSFTVRTIYGAFSIRQVFKLG